MVDVLQNPKYSYLLGKQPFYYKALKILFYYYCKTVFSFYTPLKVTGRQNLPDSSFIFCSNHNSHMDVALLSAAAKKSFNFFGMLAARDYWFDSWMRRVAINSVMNLIPVDRKVGGVRKLPIEDTLKLCRAFMDYNKRNLVLFPEGTRGEPGTILPFKKGAASFSINLNKPILPAVIHGSHKSWAKNKFFMRPTKIHVYILKPIYPNEFIKNRPLSEKEHEAAIEKMTNTLEKTIKEKANELYG